MGTGDPHLPGLQGGPLLLPRYFVVGDGKRKERPRVARNLRHTCRTGRCIGQRGREHPRRIQSGGRTQSPSRTLRPQTSSWPIHSGRRIPRMYFARHAAVLFHPEVTKEKQVQWTSKWNAAGGGIQHEPKATTRFSGRRSASPSVQQPIQRRGSEHHSRQQRVVLHHLSAQRYRLSELRHLVQPQVRIGLEQPTPTSGSDQFSR